MIPTKSIEKKIRAFDQPLTPEMLRSPGKFGFGSIADSQVPDATTSLVCGCCSIGCSLNVDLKYGQAINLTPNQEYPVNQGMACSMGWGSLTALAGADRAVTPLYRLNRGGEFLEIDWKKAAGIFCDRMRAVQYLHGRESVAFLSTGQICTEEMALLGAFAKFEMGMAHGSVNTRQCMAGSAEAYKESFGFDAPSYTYRDLEKSDVIVLVGSNLCIAHPILWQRLLESTRDPEVVVIDPRKTETAMRARLHVALQPGTDQVLLCGIADLLIRNRWIADDYIQAHTNGFAEFAEHVGRFSPRRVARTCGISVEELELLAGKIRNGKRVSFWWSMGVNQGCEAAGTARAIINLALMTGNIGKPGTGPNSIAGQCNSMGSRLFSNTGNLLGGHDFRSLQDRQKVANILGIEKAKIPDRPGWTHDQIIDGIEAGKIKALWVVATNGAHSWIGQSRFKKVLSKLEFLVVQDLYPNTETAQLADLVLPAAGWGEKNGTLINSERRIGLVKRVSLSPGQALADFTIFRLIAKTWGAGSWLDMWRSPEEVFQILKELTRGQPCDFSGIRDYQQIDESGGIQWPLPETGDLKTHRRLFADGRFFTPDQRANFVF